MAPISNHHTKSLAIIAIKLLTIGFSNRLLERYIEGALRPHAPPPNSVAARWPEVRSFSLDFRGFQNRSHKERSYSSPLTASSKSAKREQPITLFHSPTALGGFVFSFLRPSCWSSCIPVKVIYVLLFNQ